MFPHISICDRVRVPLWEALQQPGNRLHWYVVSCFVSRNASSNFLSTTDYAFVCQGNFVGGGWLQVRHKSFTSPKWHQATDGMRGFDVYGYPGLEEYSVYFNNMLTPGTELAFVLGKCNRNELFSFHVSSMLLFDEFNGLSSICLFACLSRPIYMCKYSSLPGDFRHWLITTWDQIDNSAGSFGDAARTVLMSSTSNTSC